MQSLHTEEELIFSFPASEFGKLNEFLKDLEPENSDFLYAWNTKQPPRGVWPIEVGDGQFILFVGEKEGHTLLKKKGGFEELREKFLQKLSF